MLLARPVVRPLTRTAPLKRGHVTVLVLAWLTTRLRPGALAVVWVLAQPRNGAVFATLVSLVRLALCRSFLWQSRQVKRKAHPRHL